MTKEWRRIRNHWEKARITDGQFISQSEAMGAHYGALAREIVRRDFGEARPPSPKTAIGHSKSDLMVFSTLQRPNRVSAEEINRGDTSHVRVRTRGL